MKLFSLVSTVLCYGKIGHYLSGAIAQQLLSDKGLKYVEEHLRQHHGELGSAASWADEIKSDHSYDWAKSLHYINPIHDNPPTSCSYTPGPEDCPNNYCIVTAVHNFTNQLLEKENKKKEESLLFLIHFIGDLHQPLHVTGRQRGGNQAICRFQGRVTNMHAVWDYAMFEKRIREDFRGNNVEYIKYIIKEIGTTWRGEVSEWLECPSQSQSVLKMQNDNEDIVIVPETVTNLICPEKWAAYSNVVNCKYVWPGYKRKFELSGEYYRENIRVEEKMLAQAAVRMAAIIDSLALASEE